MFDKNTRQIFDHIVVVSLGVGNRVTPRLTSAQKPLIYAPMVIDVTHLTKRYGPRFAVHDLNFSIAAGDVVGFLGPNGAGKTTTMNLLTGFLSPTEGEIRIEGRLLQEDPEGAKRHLGYLPETPPVYPDMLVCDYLTFVARLHGLPREEVNRRLDFVYDRCALAEVSRRIIGHLSKGFRQRVGIAQALVSDPKVIILDEPTVGLDPLQIIEIRDLIRDLSRDHTLILSTHILPEVTATCKKILIINEGKIVAEDTYDGLSARLRKTNKVYIRGTALCAPQVERLRDIPEITAIMPAESAGTGWIVEAALAFDLEGALVHRAVEERWGLKELRPAQLSLEEVFLKLTRDESEHL